VPVDDKEMIELAERFSKLGDNTSDRRDSKTGSRTFVCLSVFKIRKAC
jgi:hypothetical protein